MLSSLSPSSVILLQPDRLREVRADICIQYLQPLVRDLIAECQVQVAGRQHVLRRLQSCIHGVLTLDEAEGCRGLDDGCVSELNQPVSSISLAPSISLRCDESMQARMDATQPYHLNLLAQPILFLGFHQHCPSRWGMRT